MQHFFGDKKIAENPTLKLGRICVKSCATQKAIIVTADISKCVGGLPSPSQPSPVKNPSAAPIYESRAQVWT